MFMFLSFSLITFSQDKEQQDLYKSKSGWKISRQIVDSKDTTTFFYWGFQNAKYSAITDVGSLFFRSKDELEGFAKKLIEFASKESGVTISSTLNSATGKITLQLFDFTNDIYINDKNGKYFIYSKKEAEKTANEILLNSHLLLE